MTTSSRVREVPVGILLLLATVLSGTGPSQAIGQSMVTLANPNWNITLTDFGYSDLLLDNTPGLEGREYLSGEWASAVGYQVGGGAVVTPRWLERNFIFPDWVTDSNFTVVTPIAITGVNADGLPIAQSVISNGELEITLRFEMIDTVTGTPMGNTPASATGEVTFLHSNRYVMKQTCTIRNTAGAPVSNLQFFQLLHGMNSRRGVFDDRAHAGPLGEFRHDTTLAGVDPWAVGAGSSSAGLEDLIGLHAVTAPSAHEIGHYGIEGNGVDDHFIGKPSDGVHLSVENNWQGAPFSGRQGTDQFAPAHLWVAGAQRWDLGSLAAGQSVSIDALLSILTGTKVVAGNGHTGGCNGGSSVPGGLDYEFESVSSEGSCFASFSRADDDELAVHVAEGEFDTFTFLTPGKPAQIWEVEFSGNYTGAVNLIFAYDSALLPQGFDEEALAIYHFSGGAWERLACIVDPLKNTIAVSVTALGAFALGVDSGTTYAITAADAPPNSGLITGAGPYAQGSRVTLVAEAEAGYVFSNWTEGGSVVGTSPSLTFIADSNRALQANFVPVGTGKAIITSSLPSNGGTTSGGGAYEPGTSATVIGTPNPGYKFSKWIENGVVVSIASNYTFTVADDRTLVARFKPVCTIVVTPDPPAGGELEADPAYEVGDLAKLKATPNPGYCFVNWTQNGVFVSSETNFSFTVTANRELVGHFAIGNRIDVKAEPVGAGAVGGGGIYGNGAPVTVSAIAKEGYIFLDWREGGIRVSTSPTYAFNSGASRTLVANFIALPKLTPSRASTGILRVSWPAGATGWFLQESPDLSAGSWQNCTRTITVVGGQSQVNVDSGPDRMFFRLVHP